MNDATGFEVTTVDGDEMTRRLGWRSGWLWFSGQPIWHIVAEFNRYSPRRLVIVDPSIGERRVSGRFRVTGVDQFLAALAGYGISATTEADVIQLRATPS
jgi:transmembrane sensor